MADITTKAVAYTRIDSATSAYDTRVARISAQRIFSYCELHRIALAASLIDKGMVTNGEHGERRPVLDEALGMLREGQASLLIVPSMSHLGSSVGKLARFVDAHFGDGLFELVAVAEEVDTRTDNGRFVLCLLRTLARWEGEVGGDSQS